MSLFIIFSYIDPGSGLPFFALWPVIIGILVAFFTTLLLRAKGVFRFLGRHRIFLWLIVAAIMSAFILGVIMLQKTKTGKEKVVVIGFDGLEPRIVDRLLEKGRLPNFQRLKSQGTYSRLATTNPPESLVAWTSFATGSNPGKHGVFDFLKRDPKTYMPDLAFSEVSKPTGRLKSVSKGIPFWRITRRKKIPTVLIHCPNAFPPDKVYGRLFSGMGVPDIRGTMGTFSFYTTAELPKKKDIGGKVFQVERKGKVIDTSLCGPRDTSLGKPRDIMLPMKISINASNDRATIDLQKNHITLKEKEWSPWCRLTFKINVFKRVHGICRLYLKSIEPEFELYISAINFDPENPPFAITYPRDYAKELAKKIGLYHTQGMPHDTWALNEGRIDEATFLEQAEVILTEREKMLDWELGRFKEGILFCYFGTPDSIQHMFWCFIDPEHPMYDAKRAALYKGVIDKCYERMDAILGRVMNRIDDDTTLVVLSDHGFNTFRRVVHLNTWFRENGFLYLKDEAREEGREFFEDVDWSRTRAYSMGFGEIFINQIGREGRGCVEPGDETEEVKKEIVEKLSRLYDERFGQSVIKKVHDRGEIFWGPYIDDAPDLFVGYNVGYRSSWQTALGGAPKEIIEDNNRRWSGDHLFDPSLVPGILLVNRKIKSNNPRMIDVAPTILKLLGVEEEQFKDMDGKPFL